MKLRERWYSQRVESDVTVVRWGHFGRPVIIFPTAGGDAEEIERMLVIDALGELIEAGRIKVYSCDSVAGYAMVRGDGDARYLAALINGFHGFVREEMIPAIWSDCGGPDAEVVVTGASIGAFNALAVLCRFPDVVSHAIGMSGTYDLEQFIGSDAGEALFFATPLYFLPGLDGPMLAQLQRRFAILASGEGRWENIDHSWRLAAVMGAKGIPNRVDPWGPQYDHDWPTWRQMLPHYLGQLS
jgi:esterase/lipase superfamily enzyme